MEDLEQITRLASGYSESEVEAAIRHLDTFRNDCFRIIKENATSDTGGELLTYCILSLISMELRIFQHRRNQNERK